MMEDPKNIKEELIEDELKGVSGGDGAVAVPDNPLGSPTIELTEDELKGVSGGATPGGVGWKSVDAGAPCQDPADMKPGVPFS